MKKEKSIPQPSGTKAPRIFSGEYSGSMWDMIDSAKTVKELREALYVVYARLQDLEHRLEKRHAEIEKSLNSIGQMANEAASWTRRY